MHPRLFRLIETHHRIDRALRDEQLRHMPDAVRLTRLKALKLRVRALTRRFVRRTALA